MKIEKVEIYIKTKRHYADVAILVDKPDFIDWVNDLRSKWKINKKLKYIDFVRHIWGKEHKSSKWLEFEEDLKKIRLTYNRSPNFDKVITYAIAFGEVPNNIYSPCYLEEILDPIDPNDERKLKYAIIITPNTVIEDVIPVLAKCKKKMKIGLEQKKDTTKMEESLGDYSFELGPHYTVPSRKIDNIVRDRNWYWLKKKLSYEAIRKHAKKQGIKISKDGVIKAIKSYENRLKAI